MMCVRVQDVDFFHVSIATPGEVFLYATVILYIVTSLYPWFFLSYELRIFFLFHYVFFFSFIPFFVVDLSLLRFWFRFEFISRLYRVSPFLGGFPLYSPHTRIISRFWFKMSLFFHDDS